MKKLVFRFILFGLVNERQLPFVCEGRHTSRRRKMWCLKERQVGGSADKPSWSLCDFQSRVPVRSCSKAKEITATEQRIRW